MFGPLVMRKIIENIRYPYSLAKTAQQSNTFNFGDEVTVGKKIVFKKNKKVGILLQDGIN